jgi:hypothetical protein
MVHQFLTGREAGGIKPIFGLTAYVSRNLQLSSSYAFFVKFCRAMMIHVATISYGRSPDFQVMIPETPSLDERIAWALLSKPVFRRACEKEGVSLAFPLKLCGVTRSEFEAMKEAQDHEDCPTNIGKKKGHSEIERRRNWLRLWRARL